MKKQLLLALALTTVTAVGFAQSRTVSAGKRPVAIEDAASNGTTHSTIRRTPRPHSANRISTVVLTPIGSSSGNCYGGFVDNKHTFAYNADLNLLSFGHRGGGIAGNVGNQVNFDFSTDGGLTWTPQIALVNPQIGTYNTRYPNLNIWNPTGNTVLANAKAVFTGPCTNGTGWQSTYLASANYPAAANTTYDFQTAIPGTTPAMLDYASWSLTNLNGGMGYISARMDVAAQSQSYAAVDFWKIVPNGAGGFTRSIKFSSAPVACSLADTSSFGFDVAFGPDGNTGYMTHITADLDSQNPQDYSHSPALYKTMDAGETWMKLPTLNLQAIQTLVDSTVDTRTAGTVRPVVSDTRLVVDNMGKCHIFAEISSGSSVCQDSTGFTWSGPAHVLVFRPRFRVEVIRIGDAEAAFLAAALMGGMLETALAAAQSRSASFDLGRSLGEWVGSSVIVDLKLSGG